MFAEKKEEVYGSLTFYRELAYYIYRREQYERAITFFTKALESEPTDKRTLIGMSMAKAKVCKYDEALEQIAKALDQDPKDLVALANKALNLYLSCRFEDGLIVNQRKALIRRKPEDFVMGIMLCSVAIENCIGNRAGRPLRDHFKAIRDLAWKKNHETLKPFHFKSFTNKRWKKKMKKKRMIEPVEPFIRSRFAVHKTHENRTRTYTNYFTQEAQDFCGITEEQLDSARAVIDAVKEAENVNDDETQLKIVDSLNTLKPNSLIIPPYGRFPYRPKQRFTTNLENYMCEKYLDSMFLDKAFMKNLNRHPGVRSPNKEGKKQICKMSKEGYKTMHFKQELLRTRKPFYHIKHYEAHISPAIRGRMDAEIRKQQIAAKKDADNILYSLKKAILDKQLRIALEQAEKLKVYCDSKPKIILPNQQEYLHMMYKLISRGYYEYLRLDTGKSHDRQLKRVHNWIGYPIAKTNSTDSVLDQFKDYFADWKKEILVYEERLRKSISPEEMAWLYYELARHHTEVKEHELARAYSRKCIEEASDSYNYYWIVNAMMLVARNYLIQNNKNDAKSQLLESQHVAQILEDENLQDFIELALDVVENLTASDTEGLAVLTKREKQIIQMMAGCGMKDEVAFLFRKMTAMPGSRRLSVMPGVRLDLLQEKRPSSARKMSIMPQPKEEDEEGKSPLQKKKKTETKKDKPATNLAHGASFFELIKYHVDKEGE